MKEKINWNRWMNGQYPSGYFKPKGKYNKRCIHKLLRRMKGNFRKGIMNRIGINWEWS